MSEQEIPIDQNLENQLAPSGHFPGTAETLATPVGSDRQVRVRIGQADNRHLRLSKEEYRARSARQREIDTQMDAETNPTQAPMTSDTAFSDGKPRQMEATPPDPTPKPIPKERGRRKGSKNKPKPAVPPDKPIGRPYPVPSTTEAPTPTDSGPCLDGHEACMEERMSRLEESVGMIVQALTERDEHTETTPPQFMSHEEAYRDPSIDVDDDDEEEEDEFDDVPESDESCDEPPLRVVATRVEDDSDFDKGLQRLQQMIVKRNPQKLFRQVWCSQLTRIAQYNEWPPERREAFDELFNSIVAHPKFIYQMSKFLRGSRSGNCIGDEQIARVCGMVAGFLTVYQLAAAGR